MLPIYEKSNSHIQFNQSVTSASNAQESLILKHSVCHLLIRREAISLFDFRARQQPFIGISPRCFAEDLDDNYIASSGTILCNLSNDLTSFLQRKLATYLERVS